MDIGKMNTYVVASRRVKELEVELKEAKGERDGMQEEIVEHMIQAGVQHIKVGGFTIYLHTQLWASAPDVADPITGKVYSKDFDTAVEALEAHGYGEFIETKFSTARVSALIRELDRSEEGIPLELARNLKITEKVQPRVRKS